MTIITTPSTRIAQAIDVLLTAIAWGGFLYLFGKGIIALIERPQGTPAMPLFHFVPLMNTLLAYLGVAAFNALVLVLWALYHQRAFRTRKISDSKLTFDEEAAAWIFSESGDDLRRLRESRMAVVHHTDEGRISGVDVTGLRLKSVGDGKVSVAAGD